MGEALAEEKRKLVHGHVPRVRGAYGALGRILDGEPEQFGRRLVGRDMATRFDDFAEAHVQAFDRVRGVDQLADRPGKDEEGRHVRPRALPAGHDGGVLLAPRTRREGAERLGCGVGRCRGRGGIPSRQLTR